MTTVQAELFALLEADIAFGGGFAAFFARDRTKQPRSFRQGKWNILDLEQFVVRGAEQYFPALIFGYLSKIPALEHQPRAFFRVSIEKRKRLFPAQSQQQVPFARAATKDDRYGVYAAGVVFGNANNFFVLRENKTKMLSGIKSRFVADSQPGATMPVERRRFFPKLNVCNQWI